MQKVSLLLLLPAFYFSACRPNDELRPLPAKEQVVATTGQNYKPGHIEKTILCKDGTILACGTSQAGQPMLMSLSANMDIILWSKVFDRNSFGDITDMAPSPAGNYFICSSVLSGKGDKDIQITNISPTGDIRWQQTWGSPKDEMNGCIARSEDDNSLVVVAAQQNTTFDLVQVFMINDPTQHTFIETIVAAGEQIPYSALMTVNGQNIVTGTDNVNITAQGQMLMVKIPSYSDPETVSVSNYINGGHTIARKTIELPGGELLTCGSVAHNGKVNGFISKNKNDLQQAWNTEYEGDDNLILSSVATDGTAGFLAIGHVYSDAGHSSQCIVIATDPDGKERWRKIYDNTTGNADKAVAIYPGNFGGHILLCNNSDNTETAGGDRYYMMYIDKNGEIVKH